MTRRSELLMPAGSLEKLKIAVLYGADAVYLGTPDLSLRVSSEMSLAHVVEGVEFARAHGVRAYLTLNLFSHNSDIQKLHDYLATIRQIAPDGVIVADPGVFQYLRVHAPELELHVSTQANICSWLSVQFWESIGAKLVVLAREVSFAELTEIREKCPNIKIEAFIHGSMCMTYSGRCLLSNYMAERGANQGACANSCRWKYKVHMRLKDGTLKEIELSEENRQLFDFFIEEEYRGGELMPLEEDDRGSYILNAKDLCLMPKLGDYLALGVDSLKVEGRGRSAYYVAVATRAYRMAIDAYYADPENWSPEPFMRELNTIPNRGYSLAFHEGRLSHHAHNYEKGYTLAEWEFAGLIEAVTEDAFLMSVKNRIEQGDVLEFVPVGKREPMLLRIYAFEDVKNGKTTYEQGTHAGQKPLIRLPFAWFHQEDIESLRRDFPPLTVVRKERSLTSVEWARLKLDREASRVEQGTSGEDHYQERREALVEALEDTPEGRSFRTPRVGTGGCCGRGCNGCLPFWHDDKYAKARELLKLKAPGERLSAEIDLKEISMK